MTTYEQLYEEIENKVDGNYQEALNLISEMEGDEDTLDSLWIAFESLLIDAKGINYRLGGN